MYTHTRIHGERKTYEHAWAIYCICAGIRDNRQSSWYQIWYHRKKEAHRSKQIAICHLCRRNIQESEPHIFFDCSTVTDTRNILKQTIERHTLKTMDCTSGIQILSVDLQEHSNIKILNLQYKNLSRNVRTLALINIYTYNCH